MNGKIIAKLPGKNPMITEWKEGVLINGIKIFNPDEC